MESIGHSLQERQWLAMVRVPTARNYQRADNPCCRVRRNITNNDRYEFRSSVRRCSFEPTTNEQRGIASASLHAVPDLKHRELASTGGTESYAALHTSAEALDLSQHIVTLSRHSSLEDVLSRHASDQDVFSNGGAAAKKRGRGMGSPRAGGGRDLRGPRLVRRGQG